MGEDLDNKLKFQNPFRTLKGEERASVAMTGLKTLWLNTGTLCNLECQNCYIESGPKNDRLLYFTHKIEEMDSCRLRTNLIGLLELL